MNKADFDLMEKIFGRMIVGGMYQGKSKRLAKLEEDGLIVRVEIVEQTRFGKFTASGWRHTFLGNMVFCCQC